MMKSFRWQAFPALLPLFTGVQLWTTILVGGMAVWPSGKAVAVSASPQGVDVTQPDGTKFRLHLRGDEHFAWHETSERYAVAKDPADGYWKFARPGVNKAEFQPIPEARVGRTDPARFGVRRRAMPPASAVMARVKERQRRPTAPIMPSPIRSGGTGGLPTTGPTEETPPQPPARIPVLGTKTIKNIVILACFNDHWDSGNNTVLSSKGRVAASEYSNLFNEVNHTEDGAVGSVRDYYDEVSYGQLTVQSVVTAWVRLPQNEAHYGADGSGAGSDTNVREMVADAITAADAAGFNFSQGDSDADGWVDCLTIIHSGHGQELSGNPADSVWSHNWSMTATLTRDGVKMRDYHSEPALRGNTSSTSIIRIGVICHEMGHFFGLPDLYDYSGATLGLGDWCLMAGGSWNGSSGHRPAHLSAWAKCFLGFANPFQVRSQSGISLPNAEENPVVGLLRDGMPNGEYFLIENRAKIGFDNDGAIFPGVLIYHVDTRSANNDLNSWPHPLVKIEEADGDDSLGIGGEASEAGDVWTSTSGLAGGFRDQTGNPSANAMGYQNADYDRDGALTASFSYNRLSGFSVAGSTMTLDASTLRTAVNNLTVNARDYSVSWAACSDATRYEIQEGVRVTQTSFSDGAEDEDAMHEHWWLGGTAHRDSEVKNSGSYSYAMPLVEGTRWYSPVQSLTLRRPFRVTASTAVSFYFLSHLAAGSGELQFQISKDAGATWHTIESFSGNYDPWAQATYSYADLSAAGLSAGDVCNLRFVANIEEAWGWNEFPGYGFALDDISLTGIEMEGYGNWALLNDNVAATSYGVTGRAPGIHAYRVRAFVNSAWQAFGTVGEITVNNRPPVAEELNVTRTPGLTLKTALAEIATKWSDPDNDSVKLTSINLVTTNAVTLTPLNLTQQGDGSYVISSSAFLGYASNLDVSDRFSYTITDALGASTVGYVNILVPGDPMTGRATDSVTVHNGAATVTFAGIPGYSYQVQRSVNLTDWTAIWTTNAPAGGRFSYTDDFAGLEPPPASAFYRLTWTP